MYCPFRSRLLAELDRAEHAAGLLAYVQQHHASRVQTRETARQMLEELEAQQPPGIIQTAKTALEQITVGALLEQVLTEL